MRFYYKMRHFCKDSWWSLRARWQRFLRGYAWIDVWNIDHWFIAMMEPMLRHLSKEGVGYPCGYTPEEWSARLNEMADHLHLMDEENVICEVCNGDYLSVNIYPEMAGHKERFFDMFSEDFYNMWD